MIKKINHIGFVVENIDDTLELLSKAFGAVEVERQSFPQLGQTSCIVQIGESKYELMESLGKEGVVPGFLAKHGPGFHHISLHTDNLKEAIEQMEAAGIKIVGQIEDTAFTNPKSSGGIVYEVTTREF